MSLRLLLQGKELSILLFLFNALASGATSSLQAQKPFFANPPKPLILRQIPLLGAGLDKLKMFGCPLMPKTHERVEQLERMNDRVSVTKEDMADFDLLLGTAEPEQLAQITLLRAQDFHDNLNYVEKALLRIQELWENEGQTNEQRSWLCKAFWVLAIHTKSFIATMKIKGNVESYDQQSVASILWAFAVAGLQPKDDVVQDLQKRAMEVVGSFTHESVAATFWSFATLGMKPRRDLMESLQKRALEVVHDFSQEDTIQLLWAFAKIGVVPRGDLLDALQPGGMLKYGTNFRRLT